MRKRTLSRAKLVLLSVFILARAAFAGNNNNQQPPQQQAKQTPRHVDLVIALDTSSSMDGLIDSARQKLWDIVLLMGKAKPTPVLRVGLISYGNTGYDSSQGWVRKDADLTTDLDSIYSKLFGLKTNGGEEYVARAVHDATTQMQWSQESDALKIVFVAGNEPADQDPKIPVESAVQNAREHGIFVNAIYCGQPNNGEAIGWQHVASLGKGRYAAIDQNRVVAIATPMDDELNRLSGELNKTYIGYGSTGVARAQQQVAQDKNASSQGAPVAASRSAAKASPVYSNEEWDLVDAKKHGKSVSSIPVTALPAPVAAMPPPAREAYVEQKSRERSEIQRKIADVAAKRDEYIKNKKKAEAKPADGFDDAMMGAIRGEAEQKGYSFH